MSYLRDFYMDHCHACGEYMEPEEIDDNPDMLCEECKEQRQRKLRMERERVR